MGRYALFVVGPPGAGKTTFCRGLRQALEGLAVPCQLVNLDPANEGLEGFDVDCREHVKLQLDRLGPNGALLAAMETVRDRVGEILPSPEEGWTVFDLPGQVELFTTHAALKELLQSLCRRFDSVLAANITDATSFQDRRRYLSTLLLTLKTTLYMECPVLNVMSKIDLAPLPLRDLCGVEGIRYFGLEGDRLSAALLDLLEDFSLVRYTPLAVEDPACMAHVWHDLQLMSGSIFVGADVHSVAHSSRTHDDYLEAMQAKYGMAAEDGLAAWE